MIKLKIPYRHVIHTIFIALYAFLWDRLRLSVNKLLLVFHNDELFPVLLPILCIIWPVCVSDNEKINIRTILGTLRVFMVSCYMRVCDWNSSIGSFTWKRRKDVFLNDVSHFVQGKIRKVSFIEFGSKLQNVFFFNHLSAISSIVNCRIYYLNVD